MSRWGSASPSSTAPGPAPHDRRGRAATASAAWRSLPGCGVPGGEDAAPIVGPCPPASDRGVRRTGTASWLRPRPACSTLKRASSTPLASTGDRHGRGVAVDQAAIWSSPTPSRRRARPGARSRRSRDFPGACQEALADDPTDNRVRVIPESITRIARCQVRQGGGTGSYTAEEPHGRARPGTGRHTPWTGTPRRRGWWATSARSKANVW